MLFLNYIFRIGWMVGGAYEIAAALEYYDNGEYLFAGLSSMIAVYAIIYLVITCMDAQKLNSNLA